VADRAIGSDQDQKYVVIVQPDGLSRFQRVELGPIVDGLRVVCARTGFGARLVFSSL
jgi:membrane fusion protein, multidrug efflux system